MLLVPMVTITESALAREPRARRVQVACLIASALAHLSLLLALPAPRTWTQVGHVAHIGPLGPEIYLGKLNPQDHVIEDQEALAARRISGGAFQEEAVRLPSQAEEREAIRRRLEQTQEHQRGEASVPVLELGEDWAIRASSEPSSRSRQFVIHKLVRPEYPVDAILHGIEGLVRVQAWIDTEGAVRSVEILDSEVDASCELETRRAMLLWRFRPYRVGGKPVEFSVIVPFRFRLM
jgi:TonB family protein